MAEKTPLTLNQIAGVVGNEDCGEPVAVYAVEYVEVPKTQRYEIGGKTVVVKWTALEERYPLLSLEEVELVDFEIDDWLTDLRYEIKQLPEVSVKSILNDDSGGPGITGRYYAVRRRT